MNIHFIAIGGSAMHNLALALHHKGHRVTGSDDEIFEPSKSRLEKAGLLPCEWGWFPEKINSNIDVIILGMHARLDNPELIEAQKQGIKIYSYPEYLYEECKDKKRIVVGGSHGKTSTTSMIMHVLKQRNIKFDYMVGALLDGFDTMVGLDKDSEIAIFEGDEYLSSSLDLRPKFHHYKADIAILTGIAWDHMNVFPTFEDYVEQFAIFAEQINENGKLIYFEDDTEIQSILSRVKQSVTTQAYNTYAHKIVDGVSYIGKDDTALEIFGKHNLQNLSAAYYACREVGISEEDFIKAISTYKGANKRLQLLASSDKRAVYLDFAHSPSKLVATINSVKEQYPDRQLIACMELHTFSSLNADFLPQYADTMKSADKAIVYFDPKVVEHKKLPAITNEDVKRGFNQENLTVYTDNDKLISYVTSVLQETSKAQKSIVLIMTSGNFSGVNLQSLANELV